MMPKRERFIQGLVLAGGGTLLASSAVVPASAVAADDDSKSEVTQVQAGKGLDWERVAHPKRPPNG